MHYSFFNQPRAMQHNFRTLANAVQCALPESYKDPIQRIVNGHASEIDEMLQDMWSQSNYKIYTRHKL